MPKSSQGFSQVVAVVPLHTGDAKGRVAGAALPQHSALKCKAVIRSILKMFSPDVFPFDMKPALLARAQECIVA